MPGAIFGLPLHSSHALRCVAAYFFAKGADANEISFG